MNESRINELMRFASEKQLDQVLIFDQFNIRALTGVNCDAACLEVRPSKGGLCLFTDFRYVPMVHRVAPSLEVRDVSRLRARGRRIGYESTISHARYLSLAKRAADAEFVDVHEFVTGLRMVKTDAELAKIRVAELLNDEIWCAAQKQFRVGMTEREMARIIQRLMVERGDGEAFETIVCVGENAAECHHEPDDTVWNGREPVLVDMGVRLDGVCSDMTRNLVPKRPRPLYRKIYELVLKANRAAIAAARPGMTGRALDKVARDIIAADGFGDCFGHSLGHGVGYEIHEGPTASRRGKTILQPGMTVTIEPGVYLEDNLGVRIEDLVVITEDGCEVLSHSPKDL